MAKAMNVIGLDIGYNHSIEFVLYARRDRSYLKKARADFRLKVIIDAPQPEIGEN